MAPSVRRPERVDEDEVDIHEGLESTLTLIRNQPKDRVTVHKDYGDAPRWFDVIQAG